MNFKSLYLLFEHQKATIGYKMKKYKQIFLNKKQIETVIRFEIQDKIVIVIQ